MSVNQEDLTTALQEALGGRPSSEEGLEYARRILEENIGRPGVDTGGIDALRDQQEGVLGALKMARERLMEQRGPSRAEKLFALSAGFGAPTKTGSIGETAANVAGQMLPIAQEQRQFEGNRDAALSQLDLAEAQVMGPVTQAEIDLQKLEFQQRQQNMREALKTVAKGAGSGRGSVGSKTREAKIADLMNEWEYDRKDASALVDKFVRIELIPETGRARLINVITRSVSEVPIGSLKGYIGPEGNVLGSAQTPDEWSPPPTGLTPSGEVDRRTQEEKDVDLYVSQAFGKGASIYDMAGVGSGPIPTVLAGLSIPSSMIGGPRATETIIARQGLRLRAQGLAKSLIDNPRMPNMQVVMALEAAGIKPSFIETGPMMQDNIVALDAFLYQKYLDYLRYANDSSAGEDLRVMGQNNAAQIGSFLRDLGVPLERQRRSPFVPIDPRGIDPDDVPTLGEGPPAGVPVSIWLDATPEEKVRLKELSFTPRGDE